VMMYPIALGRQRPRLFVELAAVTGGSSFHVQDDHEVDTTMRRIARELRHQYLIGYSPSRTLAEGHGEWRSIRVEVGSAELRVRARDGYVND
jgi:Ca-activated chloride channel homolog